MGSPNRIPFTVSGGVKQEATEYDFGLGLKMMMMGNHHHHQQQQHHQSHNHEASHRVDLSSNPADFGAFICSNNSDSLGGGRVFTNLQRQELERQTIIFKYMAASVPVPSELLIPMNSKYSSNGGCRDQEPWRCRRTDGKKWRCAKDAIPDQKYCERHSHKGRPSRSRKHVESSPTPSNSTRRAYTRNTAIPASSASAVSTANITLSASYPYHNHQPSPAMFMSQQNLNPSQCSNSRSPDWFLKREADHDQSTAYVPTASPFFGLHQMPPTHPTRPSNSEFMLSLGDKSVGVGIGEITGNPPAFDGSLLTLSMAGGGVSAYNKENEDAAADAAATAAAAQLGMGLYGPDRNTDMEERYAWMGSLAPGGPLAEALCLGIIGADSPQGGADGYQSSYHGQGKLGFMK